MLAMNLSSARSDKLDCESKDGNRGDRFILDSLLSVLTDWNCGIFGFAPVVLVLCRELVVADFDGDAEALLFPALFKMLLLLLLVPTLLFIRLLLLLFMELKLELPV